MRSLLMAEGVMNSVIKIDVLTNDDYDDITLIFDKNDTFVTGNRCNDYIDNDIIEYDSMVYSCFRDYHEYKKIKYSL